MFWNHPANTHRKIDVFIVFKKGPNIYDIPANACGPSTPPPLGVKFQKSIVQGLHLDLTPSIMMNATLAHAIR